MLWSPKYGEVKTWEPHYHDSLPDNLTLGGVEVGYDGNLYLVNSDGSILADYGKTDPAAIKYGFLNNSQVKLTLNPDGSVSSDAAGGTKVNLFSPTDLGPYYLYHPQGGSDTLFALLDVAQKVFQSLTDPLQAGHPSDVPDVSKLLTPSTDPKSDSLEIKGTSSMGTYYTINLDKAKEIASGLQYGDHYVGVKMKDLPAVAKTALTKINGYYDSLNTDLKTAEKTIIRRITTAGDTNDMNQIHAAQAASRAENGLVEKINTQLGNASDRVAEANKAMEEAAHDIGDKNPTYDQGVKDGYKKGFEAGQASNSTSSSTSGSTSGSGSSSGSTSASGSTSGSTSASGSTSGSTSGSGTTGGGGTDGGSGTGTDTGSTGTASSGVDATGASTGSASGGGMDSSMLMLLMMPLMILPSIVQMILQQMQQEDQRKEKEKERREREQGVDGQGQPYGDGQGQMVVGPDGTPQVVPATTDPNAAVPVPVSADGSAPPTVAGAKSDVSMKLPDGSTQQVSSVVAGAVNHELNNPNGSDARAAYEGTPGQATPGSPWNQIDSSHLHTGDVVQWDNRSAVVVVDNGSLQMVANGHLVPLDPQNPPDGGQGGYGDFRGFYHPSGADVQPSTTAQPPAAGSPGQQPQNAQPSPAAPGVQQVTAPSGRGAAVATGST
ncbi:hypothetical protein [Nocardia sp. BMG111209]|uniref:hypothetical protein n=1 Tax=Nocardia sp. BMG111209 TaxID=1160137 RepID=UPI0012DC8084|nr:hypothetical protein [Nocardia sp. BMG111209]